MVTSKAEADRCQEIWTLAERLAAILDRDLGGNFELNVALGAYGADTAKTSETLHCLGDAARQLHQTLPLNAPRRRKMEDAETSISVELYHLYRDLGGAGGPDSRPVYEFVKACAGFIGFELQERDIFRKTLALALKRHVVESEATPITDAMEQIVITPAPQPGSLEWDRLLLEWHNIVDGSGKTGPD